MDWFEIAYLGYDVDVDDDGLMCPRDWDSDGDWIMDGVDPNPLVYNHANGSEAKPEEIITVNNELGVSVIIKYDGVSTIKANIVKITPTEGLNMPVGPNMSISTTSTETYTAEIRIRVPDTLPAGASEERFAMYRWDYDEEKWSIAEKTGVDLTHHYIWAETSDLSQWGNGDSDYEDSDEDGLTDWYERTTYYPIISYDFESGAQEWTTTGAFELWNLQSAVAHSGSKSWHAGGWYMHESFLTSPWVDLGVAKEPRLSLWQRSGAAGGDIDLTQLKVYTATGAENLGYLPSSVNTWGSEPVIYDLSEYEGETVQIEFYFYGYETSDHRYIDDVSFEGRTDELIDDTDGDSILDGADIDPFGDAMIKLTVSYMKELDEIDIGSHFDPFFKMKVEDDLWNSDLWTNSKVPLVENVETATGPWTLYRNIPDDQKLTKIAVQGWDDDPVYNDLLDICDVGKYLNLVFDAEYNLWWDIEEQFPRPAGSYGLFSGTDDGSILVNNFDFDAEIELTVEIVSELSEVTKQTLANDYSPVLYFHEDENYYPYPVEAITEHSDLYQDGAGKVNGFDGTPNDLVIPNGDQFYLDFAKDGVNTGKAGALDYYQNNIENEYDCTIYSNVFTAFNEIIVIQYWFVYVFNPGQADHESDIEMIQVILDSGSNPIETGYSNHYTGSTNTWSNTPKESGTDHVKVFIAKGSHGSFYTEDKSNIWGDDRGDYGEQHTYRYNEGLKQYKINLLDAEPWLRFNGRWGYSEAGTAPNGLVYRHSKPAASDLFAATAYFWIDSHYWQSKFQVYICERPPYCL